MYTEQEAKDIVDQMKDTFRSCPISGGECKKSCVCYRDPYCEDNKLSMLTLSSDNVGDNTFVVVDFRCTHKLLGRDD